MTDTKGQQEPSMEEILASIRRIISEDTDQPGPATPVLAAPRPVAARPPEGDVLELTQKINDDGSVVRLDGKATKPDPDFDFEPPMKETPLPAFDERSFNDPSLHDFGDDGDSLLSNNTVSLASDAFAALSEMTQAPEPEPVVTRHPPSDPLASSITLEDLVREALKPALKSWLDQNLPPLVEQLVKAEIQRLGGGARRR